MLLSLAEVARRLGVSEPTARKIVREWPSVRAGKRLLYPAAAVVSFANSGTVNLVRETAMIGVS